MEMVCIKKWVVKYSPEKFIEKDILYIYILTDILDKVTFRKSDFLKGKSNLCRKSFRNSF